MTFFPPGRLLILPSSLAVGRERLRQLNQTENGVLLDARIYHFGRLERELAAESLHGLSPITDLGREMLIARMMEQVRLETGWPEKNAGPGLIRQTAVLLEELKLEGITPDRLRYMAEDVSSGERLNWLGRVYEGYENHLRLSERTDRAGVRLALLDFLQEAEKPALLARVTDIRLQGFTRLTPFQLSLTKALARLVERVEIRLSCPSWIFAYDLAARQDWAVNPHLETLNLIRQLEALGDSGHNLELHLDLQGPEGLSGSAQAWTRENLFRPQAPTGRPPSPGNELSITAAASRYEEIEEICRSIRDLLDQGIKPESIAIGLGDLSVYGEIVEDVFRRYQLPLFFRRGAPLQIQAPARALLALLRLSSSNWERHLVLDLLASPYLNICPDVPIESAGRLTAEAGVTDERAGGGWRENLTRLAARTPDTAADINALLACLDNLQSLLKPFTGPRTWEDFTNGCLDLLLSLGLEKSLRLEIGRFLQRDIPAWAALRECLDSLKKAAGEAGLSGAPAPPDELLAGLRRAMAEYNIGRTRHGGGVMVLNLFDLHGLTFEHLFLAGMNEGEFPKPEAEGLLLNDDQRRALNEKAGRRILSTTTINYRRQELLLYQALASAAGNTYISYSRMDEQGRLRLPSALLDEIIRLWPDDALPIRQLPPQTAPPLERALTREELFSGLAQRLLRPTDKDEPGLAAQVLAVVVENEEERLAWVDIVRRSSPSTGRVDNGDIIFLPTLKTEALQPWLDSLKSHEGLPLLSPTFLEQYGRCPFDFWAARILALEDPPEAEDEMNRRDEGSLLHDILHRFLSTCRDRHMLPLKGAAEEAALLETIASAAFSRAGHWYPVGRRPLWRARQKSMMISLRRWLDIEQGRGDEFLPTYFELDFGPGKAAPAAAAPFLSGGGLAFRGRIDRVDISPSECLVTDYKNSADRYGYARLLKEEELGLTSFQAPLYQVAASNALKIPARATWAILRNPGPLKTTPSTGSQFFSTDPETRTRLSESGAGNFFNRLEETWNRLLSGDFSPQADKGKCDFCSFVRACRVADQGEES